MGWAIRAVCVRHSVWLMGKGEVQDWNQIQRPNHVCSGRNETGHQGTTNWRPPEQHVSFWRPQVLSPEASSWHHPHLPGVQENILEGLIVKEQDQWRGKLAKGAKVLESVKEWDWEIQKQWGQDNQRQLLRALTGVGVGERQQGKSSVHLPRVSGNAYRVDPCHDSLWQAGENK